MLESLMKLKEWLLIELNLNVKYERCKKLKGQQLFEYYTHKVASKTKYYFKHTFKYNNI
jgi:hypothetical protein